VVNASILEARLPTNEIPEFVRTLFAVGFDVLSVTHQPNFTLVDAVRNDEFGLAHRYAFAYAGDQSLSAADRNALLKLPRRNGAQVVTISDTETAKELVVLSRSKFFGKVGGPVSSVLALEPNYSGRLIELGFNRLPPDLRGRPDDLFESHVHAGLQFLLCGRVIKYGQERRFEAVSDGVTIGKNSPLMLYDCKSSEHQYEFSKAASRQFADYVNDFHRRYEQSVGRLYAFLVVSSAFQEIETLRGRSDELYSACSIPMVCLTTETLADLVSLFSSNVAFRSIVDWKNVFRAPIVDVTLAREQLAARQRDGIARG
jgi:hypothetical protein